MLVHAVPEVKNHFNKIAKLSKKWKSIIDNWDLIEKTFIDEVGLNWCNGSRAPKTYALMKQLESKVPE